MAVLQLTREIIMSNAAHKTQTSRRQILDVIASTFRTTPAPARYIMLKAVVAKLASDWNKDAEAIRTFVLNRVNQQTQRDLDRATRDQISSDFSQEEWDAMSAAARADTYADIYADLAAESDPREDRWAATSDEDQDD